MIKLRMMISKTFAKAEHDEVAEWLRRWTANPLGSARVGSNPILVDVRFYGVMVSTLDFESSDPSSNLGRTYSFDVCRIPRMYDVRSHVKTCGLNRDSNPGPLAPKARIIPLDH